MTGFKYEIDTNNVAVVTMDMEGPANILNDRFIELMEDTVTRLEKEVGELQGVIITSGKPSFLAGVDLKKIMDMEADRKEDLFQFCQTVKQLFRRLEKLGKPVVAAINGTALGSGLELALACHYRVAVDDKKIKLGLPEVTFGLMPGAGGSVRLVYMLGVEKAAPYLFEGIQVDPVTANKDGIVDELAADEDDMLARAKAWIKSGPEVEKPWDKKGFRIPGGDAKNPKVAMYLAGAIPMVFKKTRGLLPGPEMLLNVVANAVRVDFDTALRIESRAVTKVAMTPEAKNVISTFFFQMNRLNAGLGRPENVAEGKVQKLGILGAGMMGQGIAYVSARAGIPVVLKELTLEKAESGKAYSEKLLNRAMEKGRMDEERKQGILALITPTDDPADLKDCDMIVEAVFEDIALKHSVTRELESCLDEDGVWGTNTSTLPVSELARASGKPENFIGIHFFSPVDKMPLVELIVGQHTSDETLAKAWDFAKQIRKTPIVVNDARGFFTSRVFSTYLDEGARLLKEGVDPVLIENLAKQMGMPVGPLAVQDETSLQLGKKLGETNRELDELRGEQFTKINEVALEITAQLIEQHGRGGRAYGGGFYEYPAEGGKHLWPGLYELFSGAKTDISHKDIKDRLLFRQIIESVRCCQEGVITDPCYANIGSILGIGIPRHTGGVLQFINTYGVPAFIGRANELSQCYGERFAPPKLLLEKAEKKELFV